MTALGPAGARPVRLTPAIVPERLALYGRMTASAVRELLAHLGSVPHLSELVADYPLRGGKMMRPSIFLAAAGAHGGAPEALLGMAAGIELFHNALLIHDDIEDMSEVRRGRPTLHALHGVPLALNAGDALMLVALRPLLECALGMGEDVLRQVLALTDRMARETAEGQALDLGWRETRRLDVSEADYLTMVLKKTAWLATIWPLQLGVLAGSRGLADPEAVVRFGFFLGAAFQIQDDVLNFVADGAYGKELHGDLWEGKRTLMLIHARRTASPGDRQRIDAFMALDRRQRTAERVAEIAGLLLRLGSLTHARTVAEALAGAAAHEAQLAFGCLPHQPDRDFLEGLVPWVFERS
ncbi:polyprenyl synthetase family protein [Thermaurantiacus sp.]